MLHDPVGEDFSRQIADHLTDIHDGMASVIVQHANRFNVRIDQAPLAFPVRAHFIASVHASALHAIGPVHIRTHQRENSVNIAPVEGRVNGCQLLVS